MPAANEIKVSVIIPIYKVEGFIERCARSLFNQTMREGIEFIFVDDATPDKSMDVLHRVIEAYPERERQIKILHNSVNRGLATTRRTGFMAARGEYIIHCDSDDRVEPEMYELMYAEAKRMDADIVGCDYFRESADSTTVEKQSFTLSAKEINKKMASFENHGEIKVEVMLWMRMFRRSFYERIGLDTPNVTRDEDMAVVFPAHALTRSVGYVGLPLYHYNRMNEASIMANRTAAHIRDGITVCKYLIEFLRSNADKIIDEVDKDDVIHFLHLKIILYSKELLGNRNSFDPEVWRNACEEISLYKYANLKVKIALFMARHKLDRLLEWLIRNGR